MSFTRAKSALKKIEKIFDFVAILFLVIALLSYVIFKMNPELLERFIKYMIGSAEDLLTLKGMPLAVELLKNNVLVIVKSILVGLIPFLFVPLYYLGMDAVGLGAFSLFFLQAPGTSVLALVMSILPHGIFEFPAIWLSLTLGIYLCRELSKKILKKPTEDLGEIGKDIASVFVFIILPLLVLAAFLESFVTPVILMLFMH